MASIVAYNEAVKTYELSGSYSISASCSCGKCRVELRDDRGNVDYGQEWTGEGYETRDCDVARARAKDANR